MAPLRSFVALLYLITCVAPVSKVAARPSLHRVLDKGEADSTRAAVGRAIEAAAPIFPAAPFVVPPPPAQAAPDSAATASSPVVLRWRRVPLATSGYRVQVSTDPVDFSVAARLLKETLFSVDDTSYTITVGLAADSTYYWRVRSLDASGKSAWSPVWPFTVVAAGVPSVPVLVAPDDGATGVSLQPTLRWNASPSAADYKVQVSTDSSEFGAPYRVASGAVLDTAFVLPVALSTSMTYYWRVRARSPAGNSAWSVVRRFTTAGLPQAPGLWAPGDGASDVVQPITLTWVGRNDAGAYDLQYYYQSGYGEADTTTVTALVDTAYVVNGLLEGTTYYWRVRAVNVAGTGSWSPTWSYTTFLPAPDQAPLLTGPAANATNVPLTPTFTWVHVPRGRRYDLQVAVDAAFDTLAIEAADLPGLSYKPAAPLDDNTIYYWRVRATNDTGIGPWSAPWAFVTLRIVPPPTLRAPANNTGGHPTTPTLAWTAVAGADYYEAQVGREPTFAQPFIYTSTSDDTVRVSGLQYATTYHWRVRAFIGPDSSVWTPPWQFTTGLDPNAPQIWPPDGALDQPTALTLDWDGEVLGCYSRLQFGTDPRFQTNLVDEDNLLTSYPVSGLSPGTTYYWRIYNPCPGQGWSDGWHFTTTTNTILDRPVLTRGVFAHLGSTLSLNLTWEPVSFATFYKVEVGIGANVIYFNDAVSGSPHRPIVSNEFDDPDGWRVQACNPGGCGPWSGYEGLDEVRDGPGGGGGGTPPGPPAPVLVAPDNGARMAGFPVLLEWSEVPIANTYDVQVATNSLFMPPGMLIDESVGDTLAFSVTLNNQPVSVFYWRVRSCVGIDCGAWSGDRNFRIETLPSPTLGPPDDGATRQPLPLTLVWSRVGAATGYHVQLGRDQSCLQLPLASPVVDAVLTGGATTSLTVDRPALHPDASYCWSVRACQGACDGRDDSDWASFYTFRTDVIPGVPQRTYPADGQQDVARPVVLRWEAEPAAAFYLVELARDAAMTDLVVQELGLAADSLVVSALAADSAYYWHVAACTGAGCSAWSQPVWSFRTEALLLPAPVPRAPAHTAADVPLPVTFRWDPLPGPPPNTLYRLHVSPDVTFTQPLVAVTPDDSVLVGGLASRTVYYWRVRAEADTLIGAWSPVWSFETAAGPATAQRYYYLRDHLGSVRATVNAQGDVVHYDDYYPFGAPLPGRSGGNGQDGDPTGKPRYTGHEREWEQGDAVYYAGARYYDALLARWNAVDPLADDYPGWSPYNYVLGNPLIFVDPNGLCVEYFLLETGQVGTRECEEEGQDRFFAQEQEEQCNDERNCDTVYRQLDLESEDDVALLAAYLAGNGSFLDLVVESATSPDAVLALAGGVLVRQGQRGFLNDPRTQVTLTALSLLVGGGGTGTIKIGEKMSRFALNTGRQLKMPQWLLNMNPGKLQVFLMHSYNAVWFTGHKIAGSRIRDFGAVGTNSSFYRLESNLNRVIPNSRGRFLVPFQGANWWLQR